MSTDIMGLEIAHQVLVAVLVDILAWFRNKHWYFSRCPRLVLLIVRLGCNRGCPELAPLRLIRYLTCGHIENVGFVSYLGFRRCP